MQELPALETLRCFAEAARLLNFRAAARAVALTPAALGQRIQKLEDQFGTRLFHRTTRTVALTDAGLQLLPYARRAIDAALDCARASQGELPRPPVEITVGTRHELGLSWVVPMLPALTQPGLQIHLYFGSGQDLVARVRAVDIDCAITSTRLTDPKLDAVRLHEERYVFVAAPKLLKKQPLSRAQHAKSHTLIDIQDGLPLFRYWRDAPGGLDSMAFGAISKMGTIAAIRELVLRGEGVAVLPAYFVAKDLEKRRLQRVLQRVQLLSDWFRLVFRADDPRRPLYEELARTMSARPLS